MFSVGKSSNNKCELFLFSSFLHEMRIESSIQFLVEFWISTFQFIIISRCDDFNGVDILFPNDISNLVNFRMKKIELIEEFDITKVDHVSFLCKICHPT